MLRKSIAKLTVAWLAILLFVFQVAYAQKTITGTVTDQDGKGIPGVTVTVKGTNMATQTDQNGNFSITASDNATLVFSSVGFTSTEVAVSGRSSISTTLTAQNQSLSEVVVIGYGTARRRDVTGSVATVTAKDFNKGLQISPDQLIQGKVAGVQILNNSGQPGGAVSVRIRGASSVRTGNQPLFVVDGVPLDGRSPRPGFDAPGLGSTPDANPLNFINPNDIASIDVLKDASAAAIYGSRAANGVVLITTKRGQSGSPKIEFNASAGISRILKKLEVLDGNEYREALRVYQVSSDNDFKSNVDALDAITRTASVQNYNVAIGGGNENGRYRLSLGYLDQNGIVIKSGIKRYTSNLNGGFKFLDSKRLGFDFNLIASQQVESIAPVTTSAGFEGSLIGQALQWNPTRPLRKADGSLNLNYPAGTPAFPATAYNPLATSEFYDDQAKTTTVLASLVPYFKITNDLEYRMILGLNYGTGIRRSQVSNLSEIQSIRSNGGQANYSNNELFTRQLTHTLSYTKSLSSAVDLSALLGYEYQKFDNKGVGLNAIGFTSNSRPYTNYFQGSSRNQRNIWSFADPTVELQSYFTRANVNFNDRFIVTGTFRIDGSNKFGKNNRYGYFPALAAAWNITNESFIKDLSFFSSLKLRAGWGRTGNQEFPAGAALDVFEYTGDGNGAIRQANVGNPDLKWETTTNTNVGIDFAVLQNRISGTLEYFYRRTDDLLFNFDAIPPAPATRYWSNLPYGYVMNSGLEVTLNGTLINQKDFRLELGMNASFLKNRLKDFADPATGKNRIQVQTGAISGQGLTGAYAQEFLNDRPLYAFFLGRFLGLDRNGDAQFEGGDPTSQANKYYAGSPNPTTLLGFTANLAYKQLSFTANMNGAFGHYIYNNTTQATLAIGNIGGNRNIAKSVYNPGQLENKANAQPVSDRYLEKGDYMKMANATLSYNIGSLGNIFRGVNIYLTGQNLFIITKYSGFDPEVNTPRPINDVPSFGIEYTPYPSARTFILGVNFSL